MRASFKSLTCMKQEGNTIMCQKLLIYIYISKSLQGECAVERGGDEHHGAEHSDLASRVIYLTSIQGLHWPVGLHHQLATGKLKLRERSELQRQQGESQDTAFMI